MKRFVFLLLLVLSTSAQKPAADPFQQLAFLQGTWEAKITGGAAGAQSAGEYTFSPVLHGNVLARSSTTQATCKGPDSFDCAHSDLFYIYPEAGTLKAIYFDNEGHTIHYGVSFPASGKVVFLSEPGPGPRFQLLYERKGSVLAGSFQMQMPGASTWTTYLDWSGAKR